MVNRLLILLSAFLLLFVLSCAHDEVVPSVDTPAPHTIVGKWKSVSLDNDPIDYELTFESNGLMALTTLSGGQFVEKGIYSYRMTTAETVELDYATTINNKRVSVRATVGRQNSNSARVECFLTGYPEATAMLDPPRFCYYHNLSRASL